MQLAYETLLKLNNVSRTEMNIFLQCVRYQDDQGQVIGAYYRYFMKLLGFKSKQTFYNVLRSLSEKKLLTYAQNVKGDFDIWINNPVYSKQGIDAPFFHQAHLECCPMERHGETGEMDGLCTYFASPACSYTTGQIVCVDGGWSAI